MVRFPPWLTVFAVLGFLSLTALGAWQWQRRSEKQAYLERLQASVTAAPMPLPPPEQWRQPNPTTSIAVPDLARVRIEGTYLSEKAIPIRTTLNESTSKALGGLGFWWMVPLRLTSGGMVFVNRGFVPAGPDFRPVPVETPAGSQTVTGLIRWPERRGLFDPADNPVKGDFFIRDAEILAQATGLGDVAPFTLDAERTGGARAAPVGLDVGETIARIPNNHLAYALTWWGLALTLMGVYAVVVRGR